ncbi:MAG: molybdopterin molybdotransferase MoeA [Bacteriovoracia bacterium]
MWGNEQIKGDFQMISVTEASNIISPFISHPEMMGVCADRNYPPFHRVMMDGIAVSFADYEKGQRVFRVQDICAAGEPQKTLTEGCMEVMTGTPLPNGADLVVQYEHLSIENGIATIIVDCERKRFDSVHLEGSDCKRGDVVLTEGQYWNGPHVGIAASMGESFETKSPKVMIISTGDELVEKNPLPHQIRRSNAFALKASLELHGYKEVVLDHLSDDPVAVANHYEKHSPDLDLMIYSGGVSKGKFDHLPNVWMEMGVTKHFHEVSQRPGKPLWFGRDEKRKTLVIGLPGNPVSSLVCLHRYVLAGREMSAKLSEEVVFKKPLTYFLPVKIEFLGGEVWAHPLKIKNSGEFIALSGSDGFIELPQDRDVFLPGDAFKFFSWRPL